MRTLAALIAATLLSSWGGLPVGAASASPVALRVSVGYGGYFRGTAALVPVRISARNSSARTIDGTVAAYPVSDSTADRYTAALVLPPGSSKEITLYVPGVDIQGRVDVSYRVGSSVIASSSAFPNPFGDVELVVGTLSSDPASVFWLRSVRPKHTALQAVALTPQTLDRNPLALATFDAIVISNVDTSVLDQDQLASLSRYVRNGGSLILVGGSDWRETLGPLASSLLPGAVTGSRTVPDLHGLSALGATVPRAMSTVSVLSGSHGAALASELGTPLVVRSPLGDGQIEYLAFDPADAPVAGWRRASPLLTRLVAGAAPLSMRRVALQPVDRTSTFLNPGPQSFDITAELQNAPLPGLHMLLALSILIAILGGLVILLGWVLPRRIGRPCLVWATLPLVLAVSSLALSNITPTLADREAVLSTISVATLDQSGPTYPATRYVSLFAPLAGSYELQYDQPSVGQQLIPPALTPPSMPAAEFGEGATTSVKLANTVGWSTRQLVLHTSVTIQGQLETNLHIDRLGRVVGTVVNRTGLDLHRTAIVVGFSSTYLGDIGPGASRRVVVEPRDDIGDHNYTEALFQIYGQSSPDFTAISSPPRTMGALLGSPPGLPPEQNLGQRIENAVSALPETNVLPAMSEATFVAWTNQPLGSLTVNGAAPQERDLTLLIKPLSTTLPHGHFTLPTGVIGAWPVEVVPRTPQYECCGPTVQPISLGPGGSATFAFVLPTHHIRFHRLQLDAYAGGADPSASGYTGLPDGSMSVYDWRSGRWVGLHFNGGHSSLERPDRLVSSSGAILVRLTPTARSGDLSILDPHRDLQLSGEGRTT